MPMRPSWVLRLPRGLREQPAWVFIGLMVALVGLGYATGLTTSSIQRVVGGEGLKGWGAFLVVTGVLLVFATIKGKPALEKLALRWLVISLLAYCSWLVYTVNIKQASMTIALTVILVVLAEIRIGFIKIGFTLADKMMQHEGTGDNDG